MTDLDDAAPPIPPFTADSGPCLDVLRRNGVPHYCIAVKHYDTANNHEHSWRPVPPRPADLDDAALWAGAAPALVVPKRCRRHEWALYGHQCLRCGKARNDAASRRGRTNRQRGNAIEREWAKRLSLRRVGHHGGPEDATNALFVGQAKSLASGRFPGWMTDELAKLPRTEGRIPILGVLEAPGPGKRGRRIVVIDESDWIALHGGTE